MDTVRYKMSEEKYKIAIIMTCYNRRATTLLCLDAVFKQILPDRVSFKVYLVDDGSTDGTGESVRRSFPEVIVLIGNGNLFWNRGMNFAFAKAMELDYDYYLWLNDDTLLYPEALNGLLTTSWNLNNTGITNAIVVGTTRDPITGLTTYGGLVRTSLWHPLKLRIIEPNDKPLLCDTMNGNFVLIPKEVVKIVGNLDPYFTHSIGDTDYGFRAKSKGFSIWTAPGYSGTCSKKLDAIYYKKVKMPLGQLLKKINHPSGLPFKEWAVYTRRHAGILWPLFWLRPYAKLFFWGFILSCRIKH